MSRERKKRWEKKRDVSVVVDAVCLSSWIHPVLLFPVQICRVKERKGKSDVSVGLDARLLHLQLGCPILLFLQKHADLTAYSRLHRESTHSEGDLGFEHDVD